MSWLMDYVVKSTGMCLGDTWLAPASTGSLRAARTYAVVFGTQAEAQAAADKASVSFGTLGMIFTVEAAD